MMAQDQRYTGPFLKREKCGWISFICFGLSFRSFSAFPDSAESRNAVCIRDALFVFFITWLKSGSAGKILKIVGLVRL